MRVPQRRRMQRRRIYVPPGTDLEQLARQVSDVGSPERKDFPSFAGRPRMRADASRCPPEITDLELVNQWLRDAVRQGAVGDDWEGTFPRKIWYKDGDIVYEGRLVNRGNGEYKGYPISRDEWPRGIEEKYADA